MNNLKIELSNHLVIDEAKRKELLKIIEHLSLNDIQDALDLMKCLNQNGLIHQISELSISKDSFQIGTRYGVNFLR